MTVPGVECAAGSGDGNRVRQRLPGHVSYRLATSLCHMPYLQAPYPPTSPYAKSPTSRTFLC
eukprot:1116824-Rhodomonas_salina.2